MSSKPNEISVDELEHALRSDEPCPPLEALLDELGPGRPAATSEARRRMEKHVERCAACRAELTMANAFAAPEAATEATDVDWIVDRRRGGAAEPTGPARVVSIDSRRRSSPLAGWRGWAAAAAAAAVVAVGLSVVEHRGAIAPLEVATSDALRSARVVWRSELGDLPEAPSRLAWDPVESAVRYTIVVEGVDGREVARLETAATAVELPAEMRERLEPFVLYRVRIAAYAEGGAELARSSALELRVARAAER